MIRKGAIVVLFFVGCLLSCAVGPVTAQKTVLMQEDVGLYNVRQNNPTGAANAATINAACAHANSANKIIFLPPGNWTLEADVVCTVGRGMMLAKGATLTRAGHVFTVNGPFWDLNASPEDGWNVRACGAKMDGVTDDTVAINACLASFTHVFAPAGVLLHSGTILMNIGNRLSGAWMGLQDPTHVDPMYGNTTGANKQGGTTLRYTGTGDAISFINTGIYPIASQIGIEDLLLRSTTGATGIHVKNAVGGWINRVFITGQADFGTPATGFTFAGIWLDQTGNSTDATFAFRITGCEIRYLGAPAGIWTNPTNGGNGIVTYGNNNNIIYIVGNSIQGAFKNGLSILGHGLTVNISGNEIEGNAKYQTYIDYGAAVHFVANYMELNVGNVNDVVYVNRCTGCTFENNVIFGQGSTVTPSAIHLGETTGGFTTQGIRIIGNFCAKVVACWALDYAFGITIEDNVLAFDIANELGGDFSLVESFTFKRATCDPTGDVVCNFNGGENQPAVVQLNTDNVGVLDSTAETSLYSSVMKAHTLVNSVNRGGFEYTLQGSVTNSSGGPVDVTLRVKLGGVTRSILRWLAVANSGGSYALLLRGHIIGSTGFGAGFQACYAEGLLGAGNTALNTVIDTPAVQRFHTCYAGTPGADLNADQTFEITAQLSVANANASISRENAYIVRLGY